MERPFRLALTIKLEVTNYDKFKEDASQQTTKAHYTKSSPPRGICSARNNMLIPEWTLVHYYLSYRLICAKFLFFYVT